MTQAVTRKLTLQEFLALPEGEPYNELIDGEAVAKVSPKRFHSRLTGSLYSLLALWGKDKGEVGIEWAVTLTRHGNDWVPIPDLLYISNERLTLEEFEDEPCPVPPELAIEIISPDQTFGEMTEKATDYLNAGVLRVWVVDPKAKSITVFAQDASPVTYRGDRSLTDSLFPGLELNVQQVFQQAGLDRALKE
jgi:Uma2 family endonuclease